MLPLPFSALAPNEKRTRLPHPAWLVLCMVLSSALANAEDVEANRAEAREHYARGVELARLHDYQRALQEFLEAHRLTSHFAVLYNVGQAYIALERPVEAVAALERYLRDGKDQLEPDRSEQVEAQLAALKAELAEISVLSQLEGAQLFIDSRGVGRAPLAAPVTVAPGTHVVSASAADGSKLSRSVTLQAGERLELHLDPPDSAVNRAETTGTLAVLCREPVKVWVDGARVVSSLDNPKVTLDVGRHRVTLATRGERSIESALEIEPGITSTLECAEPLREPIASPRKSTMAEQEPDHTLAYAVGGVGAGLLVAAFGHYLWNLGRYEEWQSTHRTLRDETDTPDYVERQQKNNQLGRSIDRASRVTVSLAVGGGALLGTGVALRVLNGGPAAPGQAETGGVVLNWSGVW